jgi:hypothetical protein
VVVELLPGRVRERFRWSSAGSPPAEVSGTLCAATVVVERKRPIAYVVPLFRQTLGLS